MSFISFRRLEYVGDLRYIRPWIFLEARLQNDFNNVMVSSTLYLLYASLDSACRPASSFAYLVAEVREASLCISAVATFGGKSDFRRILNYA